MARRRPDGVVAQLDLLAELRRLSRRQGEVVALRYFADLTDEDIAEVLGCSVGAVKRHASRGLAKLRVRLGDATPGRSALRSGSPALEPEAPISPADHAAPSHGDSSTPVSRHDACPPIDEEPDHA